MIDTGAVIHPATVLQGDVPGSWRAVRRDLD